MLQATRAVSYERREQIAEMLKSTLTSDDLGYIQKKRLWAILESLTDQELIILQYHGIYNDHDGEEFWERHQNAITGPASHMGSSPAEIDQGAVHESLRVHLCELGLLHQRFKRPKRGEMPEFDEKTGMMKASGDEIIRLGGVLLRHLGLKSRI